MERLESKSKEGGKYQNQMMPVEEKLTLQYESSKEGTSSFQNEY
jgi:hypothetical protein